MNIAKYVGIPYEKKNCWDLTVAFYHEVLNIDLFHIYSGETPSRPETKNLIYSNIGEFEEVSSPEFGDVIIMKILGVESHISVYIGEGRMLHTSKRIGSVIEPIARWKKHIVGFFRVKPK